MASEQSSQSHLPPAWPEAVDPPPAWANDPLGTGPRLPLPQNESQPGRGSRQASPGNGWDQAGAAPAGNGWDQATTPPTGSGWDQAGAVSQGGGWDQAGAPRTGSGWDQAGASPAGNGWDQAATPSAGDGWDQTATQHLPGLPAAGDSWQTPPTAREGSGRHAPAPETGGAGWPTATPAGNAGWPSVTPADSAVWPPTSPAENTTRPPATSSDNAVWPPTSPAEPQNPLFTPSWVNAPPQPPAQTTAQAPSQSPADPFAGASAGSGAAPGTGPGGGTGSGSFGVPNNPAVWALAATTPPEASPSAPSYESPYPGQDSPTATYSIDSVRPPQAQSLPSGPSHQPGPLPQGRPHQPPQGRPEQAGTPEQGQPGHHLGRDPSDPYRPFVTAGQISGPKTPPPERQQELWDTVFGDNYQAMGDEDDLDGEGRPVWVFALVGSVVIAVVGALLWAFMAGPLAAAKEEPSPQVRPSATTKKPPKAQVPGRLPRFPGKGSPVDGTLSDQTAAITVARLGGPWRQDQRRTVPAVYGFSTRQYVPAGTDSAGRAQFAQLMSGTLSPRLKSKYTSPETLAPVINAVASGARKKFFPEGNSARKTAQQSLSVNGVPGQLAAYEITSGDSTTLMVVGVVSTGADLPAVVYMSVPDTLKELRPDITTVFKTLHTTAS
ncbi:hypothetical protein [Streptosporangium sp. NPDC006007]|uniref:hypothetical protein n=1 Tax=Streptosporangium sp. NPDC006007 TaxID=3154575 RepID=UPI0033A478A7